MNTSETENGRIVIKRLNLFLSIKAILASIYSYQSSLPYSTTSLNSQIYKNMVVPFIPLQATVAVKSNYKNV